MIAALCVDANGPYAGLPDVDVWDVTRDARTYAGPWPVVAHPPCERWGRYWGGGPSARVRRTLGDDGGCFEAALGAVRRYGGVLEHPEASHAFAAYGIVRPRMGMGWEVADRYPSLAPLGKAWPAGYAWVCQVEQGHYGHPARKKTWLYYVGKTPPPNLEWGPSEGIRLDEGFHSRAERLAARAAGQAPVKRLSKLQNLRTPTAFRDVLLSIARSANER